jgi:DNA-binding MarR family transcriptional regulator
MGHEGEEPIALIIDIHGHYTTAPKALEEWRTRHIAGITDPSQKPRVSELKISDDEIRESIEENQLKLMRERGSDLTVFSPRASFMAHHLGDFQVSSTWAAICNELCYRVSRLFPDHFIPAAMLPQSPGENPKTCIPELVIAVEQYGAVAVNLNPDPSGGHWTAPPLTDPHWYPLYETLVEYDLPAMIHVSTSCNKVFHTTGAHYINADTTAFMQLLQGNLFEDFPTLRFVPLPSGELGEKILKSSGNMTFVVDNLIKRGLVYRQRREEDRRCVDIHLTKDGRTLIQAIWPTHLAGVVNTMNALTPAQQSQLAALCRTLGLNQS